MSRANNRLLALAGTLAFAGLLAACSDIYYDRRDTVEFRSGDAIAANRVTQAVDIWPRAAGYRGGLTNGEKMQSAVERYRTNKVTQPVGLDTSSISPSQQQSPTAPSTNP
jgi:hypothetical protein